jgi:arylsulfatase A-like enzyme
VTSSGSETASPDAPGSHRLDRRSFLRAGGAVAISTLGIDAMIPRTSAAAVRRRIAARPATPPPNILVVAVDQLRAPCWFGAGARGAAALPPAIGALARRGVSFARHYTASNDCTPARAALLTGLHSHQTGAMITGISSLDPAFPTWGRMLSGMGYTSYWFGKWHLTHSDRWWDSADGPAALARYGFEGGTFPSPNGSPGQGWAVDPAIAAQFEEWYAGAGGDEPWCTTVSFVNPHDIAWWYRETANVPAEASPPRVVGGLPANFETPAQLIARRKPSLQRSLQDTSASAFGAVPFEGPGVAASWAPFLDLYVRLQREVDGHVARVLAALASRPRIAANTVVVFTSDHGEYGASHGLRGKGASMYEEAIRVPLIVADNGGRLGLEPGVRRQLTSSVDVAPLLPGRRFALHATDEVVTEFAHEAYAASAPLHVTGIVTPTHKYATYSHWRSGTLEPVTATQERELYDFTVFSGRLEVDNEAGHHPQEERLQALLAQATATELQAPLPASLTATQRTAITRYHTLAQQQREIASAARRPTASVEALAPPARAA